MVITVKAHFVFMIAYIYEAHLASVRFEHSVCRGSLVTNYAHIDQKCNILMMSVFFANCKLSLTNVLDGKLLEYSY